MSVSRHEILALIPHAGAMCLHDSVEVWSESEIRCVSTGHRDVHNPLRRDGQLSALHLAEYGAQAMAIHGGLLARAKNECAAPGFLASVRDLRLHVRRLEDLAAPLQTEAKLLMAGAGGWTYEFKATAAGMELGSGRVMVMLMREQE